jgi:L-malate glycosyltransferase
MIQYKYCGGMKESQPNPLRVLHISSGDLWGGAEAQLLMLATAASSHDHSYNFSFPCLLFNEGTLADRLRTNKIEACVCKEAEGFLRVIKNSSAFVRTCKPVLLVAHGYKEAALAFLLSCYHKIPWILQIHGLTENYSGISGFKAFLYHRLQLFLGKFSAKRIILVSKVLQSDLNLTACKTTTVIHNAAETMPKDSTVVSENTDNISPQQVIWIGRMNNVKRPDLAIAAFMHFQSLKNEYGSISIHFLGDGPLLHEMKKIVSEKNIRNVFFEGFTSDIAGFLQTGSILLLSSDSEGIPTVILEAMHAKVPIVARNTGGISEILAAVPEYPLLLSDQSEPESLGNLLQEVCTRYPELMAQANISDTSYFKKSRMLEEHCALYNEVLTTQQ